MQVRRARGRISARVVVCDDDRRRAGEDCAAEYFAWRHQRAVQRSERDEMPAQRVIFAVEVNAVECLLHRILVEG